MRIVPMAALAFLALTALGCARFEVYTDPGMKGEKTGFKYYTPKPYVLVARSDKKDEPLSISVIYLPDLSRPLYAKALPGWFGNSKLTMTFREAGTLQDFGQEGETKIADLVQQLGGFAKNIADARKVLSDMNPPRDTVPPTEAKLHASELGLAMNETAEGLRALDGDRRQRDALAQSNEKLALAARELSDPAKEPNREDIANRLRDAAASLRAQTESLSGAREQDTRDKLARAAARVAGIVARLMAPRDTHFSLYEVVYRNQRTELVEVPFFNLPN
jgi:hypothetical protein